MNSRAPIVPQIVTLAAIAVLAAGAALAAAGFPARARVYPLTVSVAAALLAGWELIKLVRRRAAEPDASVAATPLVDDVIRAIPYAVWGIGYYALIWVIGLVPASTVFVTGFLARRGHVRWPAAIAAGVAVGAGLVGLGLWLDVRWPRALFDLLAFTGLV